MSKVVGDESGVAERLPQPGGCGVAQRVCADVLLDPGARGGSQLARETCRHRLSPWLPTLAAADEQRALRPSSSRSRESSAHSSGPARPLTSASSASRSRSARPGRFPSGRPAARGSLLNSSRVSQSRSCRGFGGASRSWNGSVTPRVPSASLWDALPPSQPAIRTSAKTPRDLAPSCTRPSPPAHETRLVQSDRPQARGLRTLWTCQRPSARGRRGSGRATGRGARACARVLEPSGGRFRMKRRPTDARTADIAT